MHDIIIGTLRRSNAAGNKTQMRQHANEMKRLNPDSNLGVTVDQIMKLWINEDGKKK